MASNEKQEEESGRPGRLVVADWQVRLIQLLAVPGLLISFYLLLFHNGVLLAVCSASGWDDCGKVSGPDAPYSAIGPIPVALIGLVGYVVIFLVAWLKDWWPWLEENVPEIMAGLTGFAFLFTLGLTGLEIFVIQAVCRYCVVSAVISVLMFGLAISYLRSVARGAESL
ncbi:MAG: vitamin K epoxide reductase family protein [Chloroflexi bacterium]|nr:vitamin K epoxide reductase family protein [Chloroflexota bacterium]MCI0579700.1 vitamin K epoxide reductase family protein [Chloroflexota bacterium]MCI0650053.1 vitamin K epoxide reductase family protein [Chloroflexota bacterium]MCI0727014.1 vitamin K epoxide reductase family protein [Chloroflexota bacterium]